ncbi:MAG TPA: hypothetical protein VL614_00760 [Acetobacteraceae bacterium]|jgi:hypothetical protein|nr:hypothetical protein [Acetobacteraceae bacterium]
MTKRRSTMSYSRALEWIVDNDDTGWLDEDGCGIPSVTACLVADIYDRTEDEVTADLLRLAARQS